VTGRNDDMLIIRGVNVYPSQIEAVLVGRAGLSPHYQLVLDREGALDHLRVEVEAEPGVPLESWPMLEAEAVRHIKSMIGVSADLVVSAPGSLPRSQGKAVRVRDLRAKAAPITPISQVISLLPCPRKTMGTGRNNCATNRIRAQYRATIRIGAQDCALEHVGPQSARLVTSYRLSHREVNYAHLASVSGLGSDSARRCAGADVPVHGRRCHRVSAEAMRWRTRNQGRCFAYPGRRPPSENRTRRQSEPSHHWHDCERSRALMG
jgi:hypothetical protein